MSATNPAENFIFSNDVEKLCKLVDEVTSETGDDLDLFESPFPKLYVPDFHVFHVDFPCQFTVPENPGKAPGLRSPNSVASTPSTSSDPSVEDSVLKMSKCPDEDWMTDELKERFGILQRMHQVAMIRCEPSFWSGYMQFRKECMNMARKAEKDFYEKIIFGERKPSGIRSVTMKKYKPKNLPSSNAKMSIKKEWSE